MNSPLEVIGSTLGLSPRKAFQAGWLTPMLATLTRDYFSDPNWTFEPKLDGVRVLAYRRGDQVGLFTRNRRRQNDTFPEIEQALAQLASESFVVDGEIVPLEPHNPAQRTAFSSGSPEPAKYVVFDLLHLDGRDLRSLPLSERRRLLEEHFPSEGPIEVVVSRPEHGVQFMEEALEKGWEGIIAKRLDSVYVGGKSADWLKFKCFTRQEFVIGGYTDPQGHRAGFGSLLLGYYEGDQLRYAGRVGTGFTIELLEDVHRQLQQIDAITSPFADPVSEPSVHWVRPELVCECLFSAWTPAGKLRYPRFLGLRHDKDPIEVNREE